MLNDTNGNGAVDEDERLTDQAFTTVTVAANQPPTANAGGPYRVAEGSSIPLDGSASRDPNNDPLQYAWDFDQDGQFDDASGVNPSFTGVDDGVYPVQLQVSDGLLTATAESAVTVDNVAPSVDAGPDQTVPQGTAVNFTGRFTDPGARDTHTIQWDFGDGNTASGSLTPTHVYANEGTYTVTLTVTDDDGGTGTDSLTVTVQRGPEQTIHDLQARLKADKVELRWTPVAGAERYTIYRRTEGGSYTKLTDKAACTTCVHVDFGLAVNVKYYYVVTSWSRGVESLYSNEVSVTGQTLRGR